jgi:hypothetical protein
LNEIAHNNLFCSFGHGFDRDSSCFQQLFVPFNLFSLFFVFSLKCSLRAADHFTNRIQREFLFNDAIQSQDFVPASSHPRQKTNLLKLGVLSLCAAERRSGLNFALSLPLISKGKTSEIRAGDFILDCHIFREFVPPDSIPGHRVRA